MLFVVIRAVLLLASYSEAPRVNFMARNDVKDEFLTFRHMNLLTYLINYLLTTWSRVFEKLTGLQLVKKFPIFYGIRKFITTFTSARHLSLS
jgi:hypothetical protein